MSLRIDTRIETKVVKRIKTTEIPYADLIDILFDYIDDNVAAGEGPGQTADIRLRARLGAVENLLELHVEWPEYTEDTAAMKGTNRD